MNSDLYTLVSLAARYWFALLMVVTVARAWHATRVDNRRARVLRGWMPETGCIGEFLASGARDRIEIRLPIPREGVLGSSSGADIQIRGRGIARNQAHIELREGGVWVRPLKRGIFARNGETMQEPFLLRDGDIFTVGSVQLITVLFDPAEARRGGGEDPFGDEERLWDEPRKRSAAQDPEKRNPSGRTDAADPFFDDDALWGDETEETVWQSGKSRHHR
ncbi:MAG: FHA domain-containing protein [Clostridia bacterium]|nr:FHA domain-containing protein [Clostridia bacterium]